MPEATDACAERFEETPEVVSTAAPNNGGGNESERRILEIQFELEELRKQDLLSALRKGKLLIEAKAILGKHGKWLPLLEKVGISPYLAQRFMKVFRVFGNRTLEFDLSYSQALVLTLLPEEDIDDFLKKEHNVGGGKRKMVKDMTKRELDKAVHDYLEAKGKSKSKPKTPTVEVAESASADGFDKHLEAAKATIDLLLSLTSSEEDETLRQLQEMALRELCEHISQEIPVADPEVA